MADLHDLSTLDRSWRIFMFSRSMERVGTFVRSWSTFPRRGREEDDAVCPLGVTFQIPIPDDRPHQSAKVVGRDRVPIHKDHAAMRKPLFGEPLKKRRNGRHIVGHK